MSRRKLQKTSYSSYVASGPQLWFKRLLFIGIFAGFGFLVWYAAGHKELLQSEMRDTPLITASKGPIKERASDPGGMDIPNQEKKVFDLLKTAKTVLAVKDQEDFSKQKVCKAENGSIVCNKPMEVVKLAEKSVIKTVEAAQPVAVEVKKVTPIKDVKETITEDIGQLITQVEEKIAPTSAAAPSGDIPTGGWGVQLASYRSMDAAKKGAKVLSGKFSELSDLSYNIQQAEVKGNTYYRLRFIGLENKSDARSLCAILKVKGQGCLNVKP